MIVLEPRTNNFIVFCWLFIAYFVIQYMQHCKSISVVQGM